MKLLTKTQVRVLDDLRRQPIDEISGYPIMRAYWEMGTTVPTMNRLERCGLVWGTLNSAWWRITDLGREALKLGIVPEVPDAK